MSVSIFRNATSRIEVGDEAALLVARLSVALLRFRSEQWSESALISRLCISAKDPALVFRRGAIESIGIEGLSIASQRFVRELIRATRDSCTQSVGCNCNQRDSLLLAMIELISLAQDICRTTHGD